MAQRVRWVRGTFGRLAPLIATLGGLALGTMAWQLWIQRMVPGSRSNFTEFYKTRVFQADYFKDVVNNLQNPLTQERPISIMDPSYGLFAMSLLEATFLWGTVLVAFGLFRRRAGEAARLARSGVSAIVVGAVVLFAYAAARGYGVSSANTRYLLPAVPFMFGAIALSIDHLWEQHLRRIPKGLLTALVAVMLLLEGVAVSHTPDPRLNNAWTTPDRRPGVVHQRRCRFDKALHTQGGHGHRRPVHAGVVLDDTRNRATRKCIGLLGHIVTSRSAQGALRHHRGL